MVKYVDHKDCTTYYHCVNYGLRGFTLTELMIVVILIGVIASFGIPSFAKMLRKSHERSAIMGLTALSAANTIYEARNGEYYQGAGDITVINSNLSINILEDGLTYAYASSAVDAYEATATWTGGVNFTVGVDQRPIILDKTNPEVNPCCLDGVCPTLPAC